MWHPLQGRHDREPVATYGFQVLFLTDLLWKVSKTCCKVLAVSSKATRPSLVQELHLHICNSYWRYESWLPWPFANIFALVYMIYLGLFFIIMLTSKWLKLEGEVCFANLTPLPSVHANYRVYLVALGVEWCLTLNTIRHFILARCIHILNADRNKLLLLEYLNRR